MISPLGLLLLCGALGAVPAALAAKKASPAATAARVIDQGARGEVDADGETFYGLEAPVAQNPVAAELLRAWRKSGLRNADINQWVQMFLRSDFEAYAHLWGKLSEKAPAALEPAARAAYLYSLKALGVPQTFFDQWMRALENRAFAGGAASRALTASLSEGFEDWWTQSAVRISPAQARVVQAQPATGPFLVLQAHLLLRKGTQGLALLKRLPQESVYQARLSQSAMVAFLRQGKVAEAAKVLKLHYEPYLESRKDPERLATHYLSIARLLYQAGSIEGAIQFYEKIPARSPEFLTAREELTWCWLRTGNQEKLRGNLETLTSAVLENEFQPEAYVVRAISNLKQCYYAEVEKDFRTFLKANQAWAARIDANQKKTETDVPRRLDPYAAAATRMLDARQAELARLEELAQRSLAAVLPAVGVQKHWRQAVQAATAQLGEARRLRAEEYRRQWKSDRIAFNEAIRKMQFVKVELLSQLAVADAEAVEPSAGDVKVGTAQAARWQSEGDMVYPFDGVIWPDELFKLRSVAQGRCLGEGKQK